METRLRKNGLSYIESMGLSVAIMAPTAAMALNGSLAAGTVGVSVPLTYLLAMITIGLVSYAFVTFNKYYSSSGSVYAFTGAALGPKMGFLSGWTLLLTYLAFTGASVAEIGVFLQSFLAFLGVSISWFPLAVVGLVLVGILTFLDVRVSARVMVIFEGISVALILILAVVILGRGGSSGHLSPLPFSLGGNKMSSIGLGTVFAFLSFAGFEAASSLGEETANPRRAIPLSIMTAVFVTGVFYIVVSYAQSVGFGLDAGGIKAFAGSGAPLGDLAGKFMSSGFAAAIMFGATMSAFSSALGSATAGSRLLYAMGRDGLIHPALGRVHNRFRSPWVALGVVVAVSFITIAVLATQSGVSVFGYLGTIGVLALLLAYLVTNVGAIYHFAKAKVWRGGFLIIPVIAILGLGYTLYSNVFPVPPMPYTLFPYIVILWILIGLAIVLASPQMVRTISERLRQESNVNVSSTSSQLES
ncbi:APC family permease [Alicyclobacillus dauci]|uniref:APC family permease n=1 Tax=Alicyclobacillus dauci TaxID=1475485 RepID=A0ABY6Z4M7_9BACL|nr:APC family permease [Alicyclobacillus dauci]WAH37827.1 APC family permease [Alicyclobacillus dauci]